MPVRHIFLEKERDPEQERERRLLAAYAQVARRPNLTVLTF
jgi:hypothetical protein